jgi:MraZ protein
MSEYFPSDQIVLPSPLAPWRRPALPAPPAAAAPPVGGLLGTFAQSLDAAGAVRLPASFRATLEAGAILTRGFDGCLHLLPPGDWHSLVQQVCRDDPASPQSRAMRRQVFAQAAPVVPGRCGTLFIPPDLRAYAGMGAQVLFVGLYSYVELWAPERWQAVMDQLDGGEAR